jgi:Alpha-L-arabinofuranosidase B, catalytic
MPSIPPHIVLLELFAFGSGGAALGAGGENSGGAHGNFYESVMTAGYASAETDSALNIGNYDEN